MIEAKLKLLSILSNHTADRQPTDPGMSAKALEVRDKYLHTSEYTEMFYAVATDIINTLYADEPSGDPIEDLKAACENLGVSYEEVERHGVTYINLLKVNGNLENDDHVELTKLIEAVNAQGNDDED